MLCQHYKDALIDAAATGASPSGELGGHLVECASCRAAFADERSLFAAIDSGLHAAANVEVPTSLLPRVRTQLIDQRAPRHSWLPVWSALSAAVALVAAALLVRDLNHANVRPNSAPSPDARAVAEFPSPQVTHPSETVARLSKTRPFRADGLSSVQRVYVLLPTGHKQAMDVLLAGLQQGALKHEGLLVEKSDQPLEDLEVSPLRVLPMEVKPLANVSSEASSEGENARP